MDLYDFVPVFDGVGFLDLFGLDALPTVTFVFFYLLYVSQPMAFWLAFDGGKDQLVEFVHFELVHEPVEGVNELWRYRP